MLADIPFRKTFNRKRVAAFHTALWANLTIADL
jgi:hypothetical protein